MKVLLVDDEDILREMLSRLFKEKGFEAVAVGSGAEALEAARREPPAIIVSDIVMPDMDGFQLRRAMLADERLAGIPFVFYTGKFVDDQSRQLGEALGAVRFICKPANSAAFFAEVEEVLADCRHDRLPAPVTNGEACDLFSEHYQAVLRDRVIKATRELEIANKTQEIINRLLQLALVDLSLPEVLDSLLAHIISFPWYDLLPKGAIFLKEGEHLRLTAHRGLHESLLTQCGRLPLGHCLCGRAAATGEVVFADQVDERHDVHYSGILPHGHYCVPIKTSAGRLLGVFTLYIRAGAIRRREMEDSLMTVASSAAAIILRKKAENALKRQRDELSRLSNATYLLLHYRQEREGELPGFVCRLAKDSFALALVWLGMVDDQGGAVVPVADCGSGQAYLEGLEIRVDEGAAAGGPTGTAIRTIRPVSCHDTQHEQAFQPWRERAARQGYLSSLALPLNSESKGCYGALNLYSRERDFFTPERVQLLAAYANHVVAVLENDHLISSLEDKVRLRTTELLAAKEMAEAADRAKSSFLANMSHELRTPLNSILGFADLMLQGLSGDLAPEQREYLTDIMESGKHLLSLVNDILDLSKVEAGMMKLDFGEVDLEELASRSLFMIREKALRHGIRLTTEATPDLPLVDADERRLRQVLVNLLSNAVKFTPDGGEVRVVISTPPAVQETKAGAARPGPEHVTISVADTGPGIAPEDQARLFHPFVQLDSSLTKEMEGTGLGLALCKRIVDQHRGRIMVSSELGCGSVFSVILPVRQAASDQQLSSGFLPWPVFLQHIDRVMSFSRRLNAPFRLLRLETAGGVKANDWQQVVNALAGKIRSHESYSRHGGDGAFYFLLSGETGSQPDAIVARLTEILAEAGIVAGFVQASYPTDGRAAGELLDAIRRRALERD